MAAIPKLSIKNVPTPKAISQRMSKVIRAAKGIAFHPPKVLIKKWMKPMIGIPITKMPETDKKVVATGNELTTDQSMNDMPS